jgi:hypothetical protein
MEQTTKQKYIKTGFAQGAVGAITSLIVGVGIAVLLLVFVGALGGQTYDLVEDDIAAISNVTIRNSVNAGILSGFEALEQTGGYLPIIVLAVVITLVMVLVLGLGGTATGGRGGSAL